MIHVYTMSPCLYDESKSIPWVQVYTMKQRIPKVQGTQRVPNGLRWEKGTQMSTVGKGYLDVKGWKHVPKGSRLAKGYLMVQCCQRVSRDPGFAEGTKRRRARVPIGWQCVLLQISLRIKMFDFFFKIAKITPKRFNSPLTQNPFRILERILSNKLCLDATFSDWPQVSSLFITKKSCLNTNKLYSDFQSWTETPRTPPQKTH